LVSLLAIPGQIALGHVSHYGSIFGSLMLASMLGGAAGPWMAGALHDATGSYAPVFRNRHRLLSAIRSRNLARCTA
jgi:hypothetical protein